MIITVFDLIIFTLEFENELIILYLRWYYIFWNDTELIVYEWCVAVNLQIFSGCLMKHIKQFQEDYAVLY